MADYTALERMRELNRREYGIDGPLQPPPIPEGELTGELERLALLFLREDCRELRFVRDEEHAALRDRDGRSTDPGQLPLNMERDLDRACLEKAVHRFMLTGSANDAFDVYFCYLEMFVGSYRSSRKMIELLSEFEVSASSLLMKHRDHYAHSVYVFLLGLALFKACPAIRDRYAAACEPGANPAHRFLEFWGLTALFHDIGYPFELPFEEVKSYFGDTVKDVPYVAYRGTEDLRLASGPLARLLTPEGREALAGEDLSPFGVLAENLTEKFWPAYRGFSGYRRFLSEQGLEDCRESYRAYLRDGVLLRKPRDPKGFGGYMDHAVFSALLLLRKLAELMPDALTPAHADALTAIALHNSMYRYALTNVKGKGEDGQFNLTHRLRQDTHPLAWLLMLCDELQCWDRVAYGQNSRHQYHPFGFDLELRGNRVLAVYRYDRDFEPERRDTGTYAKMRLGPDGSCAFLEDILDILDPGELELTLRRELIPWTRSAGLTLSTSSFLHLFDFAVALNAQYSARDYATGEFRDVPPEEMEEGFDRLSLEYKLSNIAQAKAFGGYLDALGCFFTDRNVAYPLKRSFSPQELNTIGRLEHDRWDREKEDMGWQPGSAYEALPRAERNPVRERTRTHKLMYVPYAELPEVEQTKDTAPMNDMMRLLEQYDGLRVYRLN